MENNFPQMSSYGSAEQAAAAANLGGAAFEAAPELTLVAASYGAEGQMVQILPDEVAEGPHATIQMPPPSSPLTTGQRVMTALGELDETPVMRVLGAPEDVVLGSIETLVAGSVNKTSLGADGPVTISVAPDPAGKAVAVGNLVMMALPGLGGLAGVGEAAAIEGGAAEELQLALGLSRSPTHSSNLVQRLADQIGAKTYWNFFENTTDMRLLGQRMFTLMDEAESIHFNVSGMFGPGRTPASVLEWGSEGIGQGNVTNWEFFQAATKYSGKKTFYNNGSRITASELGL